MICLFWEWGIFGTLSLDFPVLVKGERLFGGEASRCAQAQGRLWPWPQQQDTALWPVCTLMPEGGKYYTAWPRGLLMTVKGALDHPGSS